MPDDQGPPQDTLSIASELISARAERGFSQAHLSELSGVSRSAIKSYESGRNMPGSRELRALCTALKVTPNKLLFGTEAPAFEEGGGAQIEALLRSDPEGQAILRTRLVMISQLLTSDEAASLLLLAQSIATARHGAEKVKEMIGGADYMAALGRGLMKEGAAVLTEGAKSPNVERLMTDVERTLERQGHELKKG